MTPGGTWTALWEAAQNLLADALVALFTAVNKQVDLVALITRWYRHEALDAT